jgi:hypothetical protein
MKDHKNDCGVVVNGVCTCDDQPTLRARYEALRKELEDCREGQS